MSKLGVFFVALLLLVAQPQAVGASIAQGETSESDSEVRLDPADAPEPGEDSREAMLADAKLIAESQGWQLDETVGYLDAAERFDEITVRIWSEHRDVFVGGSLGEKPGDPSTLYVKGPANKEIRQLVEGSVDAPDIVLGDNQPFSLDELEERKSRVRKALVDQGFDQVFVGFRLEDRGLIRAGVYKPGREGDDPEVIKRGIPADLRGSVELAVNEDPIASDETAFGGMRLTGPAEVCTSGWSVVDPNGTTGISGAGHCDGQNNVSAAGHNHNITYVTQHRGAWGDVEWYTTGVAEPRDFFSDDTNIREVRDVEARAELQQNEFVCQYGRSSNDRDCSLRIDEVSIDCTNDGVFNDRLVLMNGDTGIGGDSGGGWSSGFRAYGAHKGNCSETPGQEVWTPADHFDEAINVGVMSRDRLNRGQTLFANQNIMSPSGANQLVMQGDGNLVLYQNGAARWCACWEGAATIPGSRVVMQGDGNLVIYTSSNGVVWASGTQTARAILLVQDDGGLVMYNGAGVAAWAR